MYSCAEDPHENGGTHYNVSMKLTNSQRWVSAKHSLAAKGAICNFSKPANGQDGMYAWMYRYICKYDEEVYHSPGHPSLQSISQNKNKIHEANAAYRRKRQQSATSVSRSQSEDEPPKKCKQKRLSNEEGGDYCRKNSIRKLDGLLADAETRKQEGDSTLTSYITIDR